MSFVLPTASGPVGAPMFQSLALPSAEKAARAMKVLCRVEISVSAFLSVAVTMRATTTQPERLSTPCARSVAHAKLVGL